MVAGTEQHWLKHWMKDDVEHIIYIESVDAEKYRVRGSDGCSHTRMTDMFGPVLVWSNCHGAGRSGTQEIIKTTGNPWPLSEKAEFEYEFTGKWDDGFGAQWHQTQKCKVDKQVRVKVSCVFLSEIILRKSPSCIAKLILQQKQFQMRNMNRDQIISRGMINYIHTGLPARHPLGLYASTEACISLIVNTRAPWAMVIFRISNPNSLSALCIVTVLRFAVGMPRW